MKRFKNWLEGGTIALLACVLVGTAVLSVPVKATAAPTPQQQTLPEKQWVWVLPVITIGAATLLAWFYKEENCMGWPTRIGFAPGVMMSRALMGPESAAYIPVDSPINPGINVFSKTYRNGYRSYKAWGMCFNIE